MVRSIENAALRMPHPASDLPYSREVGVSFSNYENDELDKRTLVLYDVDGLAGMLRMSREAIYKMVQRDQIPHVRVGKLIRFSQQNLEDFLAQNTRGGGRHA